MGLSFLPEEINKALSHLNINFITEIRLRQWRPVIIGNGDKYHYLDRFGVTDCRENALICGEIAPIINKATGGSIYKYAEQIRGGFITCGRGIRIGLAGEYVMQGDTVNTISDFTSLNIRIPHDIIGCSDFICKKLLSASPVNILIYSKPGLGKTTQLRDIARFLSGKNLNVLVFDERNEISATDSSGHGYDLGDNVDVIRAGNKLKAFECAIRTMKPDVIITDELYGEADIKAVGYAADCGLGVIASSHITDKIALKKMPFEYFVELKSFREQPIIYDKNFIVACAGGVDDFGRRDVVGK